jgi:mannan endo-1,4-beta-mannosidase
MLPIHKTPLWIIALILLIITTGCKKKQSPEPGENPPVTTNDILVDSLATPETVALFQNLKSFAQTHVLFGHQDDLAYGVGWQNEPGRSDVQSVCGDYPAVYGWDIGDIGQEANLDGVNFENMKGWIKEAYARGGINTITMHLDNPVTGGDAWDNSVAVRHILPGGIHHAGYLGTLELIAAFLKDLKVEDGTFIPIILRPYHEHNHTWSWWGAGNCTVEEYTALWRMTVEYLRDDQQIHHLLYAISPQEIRTESQYLERYPGDEYVDILGHDDYQLWSLGYVAQLGSTLDILATLAEERGKISALTEVGVDQIPQSDWWTAYLLAALKYSENSRKTAWALVWRNASANHFFAPYPGHPSVPNFRIFYSDTLTAFESDPSDLYQ